MAAPEPTLSVDHLSVAFVSSAGATQAVRDLSFRIAPRETVALVGESGSGKSVTALAVMGLLPDAAEVGGAVRLAGRDLIGLDDRAMRRLRGAEMAMIFQEPMTSLNPAMTIGAQIAESLTWHRGLSGAAARAEALRLLEKVRIPAAASRMADYPHRFSGGMRQRVMIAMALACQPKLLIADEPTTALDVTVQAQILSLIKALQDEEGMAVLFITHDMGVVAEMADRAVVMLRGDAVEEGPTARLFAAPRHAYTKSLIGAAPRLGEAGSQRQAPSAAPVLAIDDLTVRFDLRRGILSRLAGRIHAVENVSLHVARGETLALVGESGCGKSTIGKAVVGLAEPLAGSIRICGVEASGGSRSGAQTLRRKAQMIFQDPFASLDPRQPIGDAIAEPIRAHGLAGPREARDRAAELLRQVGLSPDIAGRYPHAFSGGQRQRIAIARALALEPEIIVADESVSALDVSIKAQIVDLLIALQETLGIAYLFISHDMAVVERISHRVAVMRLGEIVETGSREAVFGDPRHPYTRKLLAAVPAPDPARRATRPPLASDEIESPIRQADFVPPPRLYQDVAAGHRVLIDG